MGPPSRSQPFPIKLAYTAIHELPYLHLVMFFVWIINGQTETELDRLICLSSCQHTSTHNHKRNNRGVSSDMQAT